MTRETRWRLLLVGGLVLFLGYLGVASFVPASVRSETPLLPDQVIRLGLDLQGGIHWVVAPDLDVALERELGYLSDQIRARLEEAKITPVRLAREDEHIVAELATLSDADRVRDFAQDTGVLHEVEGGTTTLRYALTPAWVRDVRERAMLQVLEVLRRRIDDPIQGVQDSVVTRQGADRVLVQIPGGQLDRDQARALLRKTGFLEFKIVLDVDRSEDLLRAKHPDGLPEATEIAVERDPRTRGVVYAYLVREQPDLTGEFLNDARSSLDNRYGWIVNFVFNSEGARRFRDLTAANKGKQLAIVLDGQVRSAPTIQDRIGARGFIRGRFSSQEAAELAVILRAGSLPIPVHIEEERTVGPALGADSIRRGFQASIVGLVVVVVFGIAYYRLAGVYASVALAANLLMILGIMSLAHATLTLPGIAGLVLTVGMAIDANVIIFERIREELRQGKLPRAAIRTGFNKALWTILDANITTLITAIVLFQFGTGPIKGFAVTLSIGIVTSVFTAIVITRLMFDLHPGSRPVQTLSI